MRLHEITNGTHKGSRKDTKEYQYLRVELMTISPKWRLRRNTRGRKKSREEVGNKSMERVTDNSK